MGGKTPAVQGPSEEDLKRQADAEASAKMAEERANEKISSSTRASVGRRTGRRLLLAPGREDQISSLGGGSSGSGSGGSNI